MKNRRKIILFLIIAIVIILVLFIPVQCTVLEYSEPETVPLAWQYLYIFHTFLV
ncbi:hypothetical protein FACS189485_17180 [Spirochaetia bacterium]|nr:hypothetical protein FACS189485_17180 [Spirochaetia bacterium]